MRRLSVSLLAAVLLAVLGLGWVLDQLFLRLAAPAADPGEAALRALGPALAQALDQPGVAAPTLPAFDGYVLKVRPASEWALPAELQAELNRAQGLLLQSEQAVSLHFPLPRSERVLSIEWSTQPAALPVSTLSWVLTLAFYGGVVALIGLWLWPLLQRLQALRTTAQALGAGDLQARLRPSPGSYIADIEREFNRMAQRIQSLVDDNRLLGSAMSHDLRTPLARLRFGIEALADCSDEQARRRYQQRMSADIAAMELLVEMLLEFAQLEQSRLQLHEQPVELAALLQDAAAAIDATPMQLTLDLPAQGLTVHADARMLRMAIDNLLGNALRYGRSRLRLSVATGADGIAVCVEDDGPGIEPALREHVLKPYVRGEHSSGYGLGLAIVARIAEWYQTTVAIDRSESLGGARITLCFPRSRACEVNAASPVQSRPP